MTYYYCATNEASDVGSKPSKNEVIAKFPWVVEFMDMKDSSKRECLNQFIDSNMTLPSMHYPLTETHYGQRDFVNKLILQFQQSDVHDFLKKVWLVQRKVPLPDPIVVNSPYLPGVMRMILFRSQGEKMNRAAVLVMLELKLLKATMNPVSGQEKRSAKYGRNLFWLIAHFYQALTKGQGNVERWDTYDLSGAWFGKLVKRYQTDETLKSIRDAVCFSVEQAFRYDALSKSFIPRFKEIRAGMTAIKDAYLDDIRQTVVEEEIKRCDLQFQRLVADARRRNQSVAIARPKERPLDVLLAARFEELTGGAYGNSTVREIIARHVRLPNQEKASTENPNPPLTLPLDHKKVEALVDAACHPLERVLDFYSMPNDILGPAYSRPLPLAYEQEGSGLIASASNVAIASPDPIDRPSAADSLRSILPKQSIARAERELIGITVSLNYGGSVEHGDEPEAIPGQYRNALEGFVRGADIRVGGAEEEEEGSSDELDIVLDEEAVQIITARTKAFSKHQKTEHDLVNAITALLKETSAEISTIELECMGLLAAQDLNKRREALMLEVTAIVADAQEVQAFCMHETFWRTKRNLLKTIAAVVKAAKAEIGSINFRCMAFRLVQKFNEELRERERVLEAQTRYVTDLINRAQRGDAAVFIASATRFLPSFLLYEDVLRCSACGTDLQTSPGSGFVESVHDVFCGRCSRLLPLFDSPYADPLPTIEGFRRSIGAGSECEGYTKAEFERFSLSIPEDTARRVFLASADKYLPGAMTDEVVECPVCMEPISWDSIMPSFTSCCGCVCAACLVPQEGDVHHHVVVRGVIDIIAQARRRIAEAGGLMHM